MEISGVLPGNNTGEKREKFLFSHLPPYASFLLEHHLHEFARVQIQYSREEKVPLLAYFDQLPEPELQALAVKGSREFLTCLAENTIPAFIQKATEGFIKNQLPSIDREQVVTDDITIVSFVRRKSLRYFLTRYTSSFEQYGHVMEEVDHFIMISESASFNAYLSVQQDK
jgi:hypothetical protein